MSKSEDKKKNIIILNLVIIFLLPAMIGFAFAYVALINKNKGLKFKVFIGTYVFFAIVFALIVYRSKLKKKNKKDS